MKDCENFCAFEKLINGIRDAAPLMKDVQQYLRRRRDCPGTRAFDEYEKKMSLILLEALKQYTKAKGGEE